MIGLVTSPPQLSCLVTAYAMALAVPQRMRLGLERIFPSFFDDIDRSWCFAGKFLNAGSRSNCSQSWQGHRQAATLISLTDRLSTILPMLDECPRYAATEFELHLSRTGLDTGDLFPQWS